jgi:hypothetical protein
VVGWQIKSNATWRKLLIRASIIAKCAAKERMRRPAAALKAPPSGACVRFSASL